uniref:J domain-containing protein n=1 Tax=Cannabis sativa TaxID=3483 RepID=A0A803P4Y8_CANSA
MAASGRRCHYEVLGLQQECTPDEIRSAYRKMALQLHPDKLVQSGLSQAEATAKFQELVQAYEVLSDSKERAWYDSHRSQILFADPNSANSVPDSVIPNLFSFFSNTVYSGYTDKGKGFYKVYSDVFNKLYANEISFITRLGLSSDLVREAPAMGNLDSPYAQVTAFYGYWLGFSTVMDFCWVDQYDAMAGPNRKSRRVMEEENKKLRKKAKREYNDTKFKSEKQWKNHEQSKKHREKVAEFRDSIEDEESLEVEVGEKDEVDDGVDELVEQLKDDVRIGEEETQVSDRSDEFYGVDNADKSTEFEEKTGIDNLDEDGGRKNRRNGFLRRELNETSTTKVNVENDSDEFEFMDYNKTKSTRRKRGARKERSKKNDQDIEKDVIKDGQGKESNGKENVQAEESSSHSVLGNGLNDKGDDNDSSFVENKKSASQCHDRKGNDTNTKSKNSSKGRKAKAIKHSSNTCEKCGEEFESKNKLHKHLSDTGHAATKYR